ncbi:hypothetical protein [Microvirga antarctica]|uniref:hypothetical protein n=1 Tax=Microvirga antarctica TaxID=2819233 RepID=UPI001B318309|nr:hypothetical protein [Microvirga antarctica]
MITVLIRVTHGPEALAVTLSSLVPAVTAGLIADAVILADREDEGIAQVAEAAGAVLRLSPAGHWAEAGRLARHDWLLCLDDGDLPQEGWIRVLDRFVGLNADRPGRARFKRSHGVFRDMVHRIRDRFAPRAIRSGDLIHRRILLGEAKSGQPVRLTAAIERDPAFS